MSMALTSIGLTLSNQILAQVAPGPDPYWTQLGAGIGLLVLAVVLTFCELFLLSGVTGGILMVLSIICGLAGTILAFEASTLAGWVVLIAVIAMVLVSLRWGLPRLQRTGFVPQAMITQDAGYHHHAEEMGIHIGSTGILVTDAMPTGRARFACAGQNRELDVAVVGPVLACGANVIVVSIQGAIVSVRAPAPSGISPHSIP